MGRIYTKGPLESDLYYQMNWDLQPRGWEVGTAFEEGLNTVAQGNLINTLEQDKARYGSGGTTGETPFPTLNIIQENIQRNENNPLAISRPGFQEDLNYEDQKSPIIDRHEAQAKYGLGGQLTFDKDIPEAEAKLLMEWKQDSLMRQGKLNNAAEGIFPAIARTAAGFSTGFLDPVNYVSSMIPVVGEARFAALAGRLGKFGARATKGFTEGLVGSALTEPLIYTQAQREQADYDMADSLHNILYGAGFGSVLHAGAGAIGDLFSRRRLKSSMEQVIDDMPLDIKQTIFTQAMDSAEEGAPINVAPILDEVDAVGNKRLRPLLEGDGLSISVNGADIPLQYEVVELSDVMPKLKSKGSRSEIVKSIVSQFEPELVAKGGGVNEGAPIIAKDINGKEIIESGTRRIKALADIYRDPVQLERYKQTLEQQGVDLSGFKEPVLVRRRQSELSKEQMTAYKNLIAEPSTRFHRDRKTKVVASRQDLMQATNKGQQRIANEQKISDAPYLEKDNLKEYDKQIPSQDVEAVIKRSDQHLQEVEQLLAYEKQRLETEVDNPELKSQVGQIEQEVNTELNENLNLWTAGLTCMFQALAS